MNETDWHWPKVWEGETGTFWRLLVCCVVFGGGFFVLGAFAVFAMQDWGIKDAMKGHSPAIKAGVEMGMMVLPLCSSGIGCLLGIRLVHRKPIACVFTDGRAFGFGLFIKSVIVWFVLWCVGTSLTPGCISEMTNRFREMPLIAWPGVCLALLIVISLQAGTEEVIIRGYLQNLVGAWVKRPWIAVGVSTIIFTLLHTGTRTDAAWFRIGMLGLIMGLATVRAGTIGPAISVHALDNTLFVLWLPDRTSAHLGWIEAGIRIAELILWYAWLVWVTRGKERGFRSAPAANAR